jgi:transposase
MFKQIEFARSYKIDQQGNLVGLRGGMNPTPMECGYLRVKLICDDGVRRAFLVHRLVALTYIPKVEGKNYVNHKNGIKTDNRVENLEWCTSTENQIHAYETGLKRMPKGEINGRNLLPEQTVISIYYELLNGARVVDTAKKYGVARSTIASIKKRQNWQYLLGSLPEIPHKSKRKNLSEATVKWICSQLELGVGLNEIMKQCTNKNFSYDALLDIKRRKNFKHIVKDYVW